MRPQQKWLLVITALLLITAGCNFPGQEAVPGGPPTPDTTLTALYAPLSATLTQMALPTSTKSEPSDTSTPEVTPTATFTNTALPTATTQPTNTAIPATATNAMVRPGPRVTAAYLTTAPILDGDWGDWQARTRQYPANIVVYGAANWSGSDDLESSFIVGWDYTYLYISVKANDDHYVQNASGQDIYKGDSAEILIDTNLLGDFYVNANNSDDYQIGISPGNPNPTGTREAYVWQPAAVAGTRPQVTIASVGGDGQWRIEMAIPWSMIGVSPAPGMRLGFTVSVSDNDDGSANIQQTMVSNTAGRNFLNPVTWGELVLNP